MGSPSVLIGAGLYAYRLSPVRSQPKAAAVNLAMRLTLIRPASVLLLVLASAAGRPAAQSGGQRPMSFLDVQHLRTIASPAPSPDGRWMLYTISTMDWKEAKRQTD